MNINEVLTMVAAQVKADAQALIAFAAEDTIGGFDIDERNRKFPMGSLWEPEGKILYALVRWLKPEKIAEIGGWAGCSASHLALAVKVNGMGKVYSVDSGIGGQEHGYLLLPELRPYVELIKADGVDWLLTQEEQSFGLIFEDADHSTELTKILSSMSTRRLLPGGVLVNHDASHDFAIVGGGQKIGSTVGREVRDGLEQAGLYFRTYLAEPSDCGVAVTVMPGVWTQDVHSVKTDARPVAKDKLGQPYDEARLKQFADIANPAIPESESAKQAQAQADALANIGNANIESMSPPPAPATETPKRKRK